MHNKVTVTVAFDHRNPSIRKSKSANNLPIVSKKRFIDGSLAKLKVEVDDKTEILKSSPPAFNNTTHGKKSPPSPPPAVPRRRAKRSSITSASLLSTVASVHELMSLVIYKDNPPSWLKQTDLYKEYTSKAHQTNNISSPPSPSQHHHPHHQPSHRKQRSNLDMYARPAQAWQLLPSPPLISPSSSSSKVNRVVDTIEPSPTRIKREPIISPLHSLPTRTSSIPDDLPICIKQEPIEQETPLLTTTTTPKNKFEQKNMRPRRMLCKKKLPDNGIRRRHRLNSVETEDLFEKKDSVSSPPQDSNSSSSSIEHTSPSPTTTASRSSSRRSSPGEYMRSIGTRLSSPLRIQTSISPALSSISQRRSTRIWAPSNFFINPMWILPAVVSSKRLLAQNTLPQSPPFSTLKPETN